MTHRSVSSYLQTFKGLRIKTVFRSKAIFTFVGIGTLFLSSIFLSSHSLLRCFNEEFADRESLVSAVRQHYADLGVATKIVITTLPGDDAATK
jgi:hypothetical protein